AELLSSDAHVEVGVVVCRLDGEVALQLLEGQEGDHGDDQGRDHRPGDLEGGVSMPGGADLGRVLAAEAKDDQQQGDLNADEDHRGRKGDPDVEVVDVVAVGRGRVREDQAQPVCRNGGRG